MATDNTGTGLEIAALHGHEEIVKYFLEAGAYLERERKVRDEILRIVDEQGFHGVAKLLREADSGGMTTNKKDRVQVNSSKRRNRAQRQAGTGRRHQSFLSTYPPYLDSLRRKRNKYRLKMVSLNSDSLYPRLSFSSLLLTPL